MRDRFFLNHHRRIKMATRPGAIDDPKPGDSVEARRLYKTGCDGNTEGGVFQEGRWALRADLSQDASLLWLHDRREDHTGKRASLLRVRKTLEKAVAGQPDCLASSSSTISAGCYFRLGRDLLHVPGNFRYRLRQVHRRRSSLFTKFGSAPYSKTWKGSRRTGRRTRLPSSSLFVIISARASWNTESIRLLRPMRSRRPSSSRRHFLECST